MERFTDVVRQFFHASRWPVLLMGDHTEDAALLRMESQLVDIPT